MHGNIEFQLINFRELATTITCTRVLFALSRYSREMIELHTIIVDGRLLNPKLNTNV